MAETLPRCVRLIATSRAYPPVENLLPAAAVLNLSADRDIDSRLADVHAYAHERLTSLPGGDELAQRVASAAQGWWFSARTMIDQILEDPRPEVYESVLNTNLSLAERFTASLIRHVGLDEKEWVELYRPVLETLAVAEGEGLTGLQIARITGLGQSQVDEALVAIGTLVVADDNNRLRFFHVSFRDFLLSANAAQYRIDAELANLKVGRALANACRPSWLLCEDDYALTYAARHLVDALGMRGPMARGSGEDVTRSQLRSLLMHSDYLRSKTRRIGLTAVLADIRASNEVGALEEPEASELIAGLRGQATNDS